MNDGGGQHRQAGVYNVLILLVLYSLQSLQSILITVSLHSHSDPTKNLKNIGWWADGANDEAVSATLAEAAAASIDRAARNGVAFDHGKTEAAIFRRK